MQRLLLSGSIHLWPMGGGTETLEADDEVHRLLLIAHHHHHHRGSLPALPATASPS